MGDFLLKGSPKNLVVVGVGIPTLDGRLPAFKHKFPANFFLFKTEDLESSVVDKFEELFKLGLERADFCTRSVVEYTLEWARSYTGGHAFPFLKLSEYLLRHQKQRCIDQDFESIVCGAEFFYSQACRDIFARSFQLSADVFTASGKFFSLGIVDQSNENTLENVGLWDEDENWFLSKFLVSHLFGRRKRGSHSANPLDMQKVIEIGLSKLDETHFSPQDTQGKPIT